MIAPPEAPPRSVKPPSREIVPDAPAGYPHGGRGSFRRDASRHGRPSLKLAGVLSKVSHLAMGRPRPLSEEGRQDCHAERAAIASAANHSGMRIRMRSARGSRSA